MFSEGGYSNVALIVYPSVKTLSMISGCPMVLLAICSFRSKSMGYVLWTNMGNVEILPRKSHGCYKKTNLRGNSDI